MICIRCISLQKFFVDFCCLAPRGAGGLKLGIKPVFPKRMSLAPRGASGLKCIWTRSHPTDPVVLSIAHGEQIEICAPSRHCILLWFGSAIYVRMKILSSGRLRPVSCAGRDD